MPDEEPSHDEIPAKKLTLLDGFRVGIANLDNILKEVIELKLTEPAAIRQELLDRVKSCNYVPPSAESEYSAALLQEYQKKTGAIKAVPKNETNHGAG